MRGKCWKLREIFMFEKLDDLHTTVSVAELFLNSCHSAIQRSVNAVTFQRMLTNFVCCLQLWCLMIVNGNEIFFYFVVKKFQHPCEERRKFTTRAMLFSLFDIPLSNPRISTWEWYKTILAFVANAKLSLRITFTQKRQTSDAGKPWSRGDFCRVCRALSRIFSIFEQPKRRFVSRKIDK